MLGILKLVPHKCYITRKLKCTMGFMKQGNYRNGTGKFMNPQNTPQACLDHYKTIFSMKWVQSHAAEPAMLSVQFCFFMLITTKQKLQLQIAAIWKIIAYKLHVNSSFSAVSLVITCPPYSATCYLWYPGQNKMADILQMTFMNAFSLTKKLYFETNFTKIWFLNGPINHKPALFQVMT